jgi:hypothetical protein
LGGDDAQTTPVDSGLRPEGSLAGRDFPDLIHSVHSARWTGRLTLTQGGVGKSVFVEDGSLIFASSSSADDRLGELLLRRGRISYRQLVEAGRGIAPGRRLGAILVEQGVLAPKDLVRAVIEHTQEIIYSLFLWTEGRYRLQEGREASAEAITLRMSTPGIIMEGIGRIDSWSRVQPAAGAIDTRYVRTEEADGVLREMTLSPQHAALLADLGGTATVEEMCERSELTDFEVCRCLWAFRVLGAVRRLDHEAVEEQASDDGLSAQLALGGA